MKRVVITGVGAISPCGVDTATTWASITAGQSGIASIDTFDTEGFPSRIAGQCLDFDPLAYIDKRKQRECSRFTQLAIGASQQAIDASGFAPEGEAKERVGTFIGVGFCGTEIFENICHVLATKGPRRVTPYFVPAVIPNMAPGQVSMRFGYRGPSYAPASACSSAAHAIGEAFRWIQRGGIDAAIAGGAEATITPSGVGGFGALRALSKRNDEPERASRPFDVDRDGFVIAEGAGILVLEEREAAMKRGAPILAEVVGYGATSDAYHLTQPAPEGEGAARAMKLALQDAELSPDAVDYINAHGTSTPAGDVQELTAIRSVFGAHAQDSLMISSTKSMSGHLLGAAGGLEGMLTVKTLEEGVVPPTINLERPDPAAEGLDLVPHTAREHPVRVALTNSFGFGGTNVTLVLAQHS